MDTYQEAGVSPESDAARKEVDENEETQGSKRPPRADRTYGIDLVYCVDVSGNMKEHLERVKQQMKSFPDAIMDQLRKTGRLFYNQVYMRLRFITFSDYLTDGENAVQASGFFDLSAEKDAAWKLIDTQISASGGFSARRCGYEALAFAMRSAWNQKMDKNRHIIVLWSNGSPRGLGLSLPSYPKNMARSFSELTQWWEAMDESARRLLLLAPEVDGWNAIADTWDQTIQFLSMAGEDLDDKTLYGIWDCFI